MKKNIQASKRRYLLVSCAMAIINLFAGSVFGQVGIVMSGYTSTPYTADFNNVSTWSANFDASGSATGEKAWVGTAVNATGSIPSGTRISAAGAPFQTNTSSSGVQRPSNNLVFLSTGGTDNSSSTAADFYMNFTGVNAGTLAFDVAQLTNGTFSGTNQYRVGTLKVYYTTDGSTFTELTGTNLPYTVYNGVTSSATISLSLPAAFNNSATARLRFYYYNGGPAYTGTGTITGSRPKITLDNVKVTAVSSGCSTAPTSVSITPSSTSICNGATLTLTGAATGATSYSWSGPGSYSSTAQSPSFAVTTGSAGIYTFSATNACGTATVTSVAITVNTAPTSLSATPSSTAVCNGASLSLTGTATGATSYLWSGPGGYSSTLATTAAFTASSGSAGVYTFTATNSCGSTSVTTTSVTINPLPAPGLTGTATIAYGNSTTITFSGTSGDIIYYWNGSSSVSTTIGGGGTSPVSVTPTVTTTYSVTSATSALGCTNATVSGVNITITVTGSPADTIPSMDDNMAMGNPSTAATTDANNYLVTKPQYSLSYNNSKGEANWVSWHLSSAWKGDAVRCNCFTQDSTLPVGYFRATTGNYTGTGFDRGHMCPSDDRDRNDADNSATFKMTNIAPQAPNLNQITWENLESYCRNLIYQGKELYVIAGSYGTGGTGSVGSATTIASGNINVPSRFFKIVVILTTGTNDVNRVTTSTRVIAVDMPNTQTVSSQPWAYYRTSVDAIEAATGYDFLSNVPTGIQSVIEASVDNGPTNIVAWDFTGATTPSTYTATTVSSYLDATTGLNTVSRGSGAAASTATNSFRTTGFQNDGISTANTDYFQVTLKPVASKKLNISSIDATCAGTASYAGAPGVSSQFAYSLNGTTFTLIGSPQVTVGSPAHLSTVDVSGITALQNIPSSTTVYLRYYASGQTTTGGWGFFSSDTSEYGLSIDGYFTDACTTAPTAVTATPSATSLCAGSTLTLTGAATDGTSYSWTGPDGFLSTDLSPASFTVGTASAGIYTLVATNGCGSTTATTTAISVTGGVPSSVSASASATDICSGNTLTLTGTATGATSYSWSGPGGFTSTLLSPASFTATGSSAGIYTLIATNICGSTTATVNINVSTGAPTAVTATLSAAALCSGNTLTISGTATGATSYSWSGPNSFTSTTLNPASFTVSAASAGVYSLTATNACGNTLATTTALTIGTAPTSVTATPSATSLCVGNTLTLTGAATGATSYSWSGPNSFSSTDLNPASITVGTASAGIYTLTATNSCGNTIATTASISVTGTPTVAAIAGTTSVFVGSITTLTNATAGGTWTSGTTSVATVTADGGVTGVTTGTANITYTVTNACGTNTATTSVTVNIAPVTIAAWDCFNSGSSVSLTTLAAAVYNSNLTATTGATNITRGAGATPSAAGNSFRTTGFSNNGIATSNTDYFQVTLTAATGYKLSLSTIDARLAGTSTYAAAPGVSNQFAYSTDGTTFTLIGSPQVTVGTPATLTQINTSSISALQNIPSGTTVYLRYYASGQTTTGGWGFTSPTAAAYGLALGGNVVPDCAGAPTAVSATPSAAALCTGNTLTLTGTATGASSYSWSGPNSFTSTSLNPASITVSTASAGIYTLVATNLCGSTTATASVTVNPLPAPTISGTTTVLIGSSATLTFAGTSGDIINYSWTGGGTAATTIGAGGTSAVVVSPTSTTTYTIDNATSAAGCSATITGQLATVTIDPGCTGAPTGVTATLAAATVCTGNTVTVSGTATDATSYSWSGPNGFSSTTLNPASFTANTASAGIYTLVATNACGTTTATTAALVVGTIPTAVSATPSATSLCVGNTLTLTGAATGATAYSWSGPNSFSSTNLNPASITVGTASAGIYTLTATNSCGNTIATNAAITVTGTPTVAAIAGTTSVSVGSVITLTNATAGGTWTSGTTSVATVTAGGGVTGVATGTTNITYTVTNSCGTNTATTTITVNAAPVTIAAWDFFSSGTTVTLTTSAAAVYNSNLTSTTGASNITRGAGAAASGAGNSFRTTGFQNNGIATSNTDYFQVTLTPTTGYALSVATIDARLAGTASYAAAPGVSNQFAYSTNGSTFTLIGSPQVTVGTPATLTQINTSSISALQNIPAGTTVYLRYYASGQTTTGGWGFISAAAGTYGLTIGGNLTPSCSGAPTAVTATPSATTLCTGTTLTLTGAATGATSYSWTGPNGFTSTLLNPASITAGTASAGIYTLVATNGCGSTTATSAAVSVNTAPTAVSANTSATSICEGNTITLTGAATGAASYSWSGPGGYTSTDLNPVSFAATTASAGIYTLTATNSCGSTTASTTGITVNTTPTAVNASASAATLCVGNTLTLTGAATGAISYSWSGPGGYSSTDLNPAAFTVGLASAGMYTLTATNDCGNALATTVAVNVITAPTSVAATPSATTLCVGNTLTLTGTATGATSYSWSGPNGYTATDLNPAAFIVNTASAGVYTLTATNSCGNTSATTTAVTINASPVSVTASLSATTLCTGATLTLTGSAPGATSFSWSGPGGYTATDLAPTAFTVSAASAGVYTLTASTSCGSISATTDALVVNTAPTAVTATPSATTICTGGSLSLTGAATNATSYSWSGPNGFSSTDISPAAFTVSDLSAGIYTFTATNSCGSTIATTTSITITGSPTVAAISGSSSVNAGSTITLSDATVGGTWSSGNISVATVTSGGGVGGVAAGSTNISYTVTNSCGSTTVTKAVTVNAIVSTIAAWDCFNSGTTVSLTTLAAAVYNSNLTSTTGVTNITRGAGAAASGAGNSFRTTGFQNNGIATSNTDYFQVTMTATSGYKLSVATIDARFAGTATFAAAPGVSSQFAYSTDGTTFTLIGSPQVTVGTPATLTQINTSGITALQNVPAGTTVYLRYYASGQTTTGGWGFTSPSSGAYGLAIGGSLNPACSSAPTAVAANASSASVCVGNTITLTGAATGATAYSWSGPNGFSSTLQNPAAFTVSTLSAGTYTLTASNTCGVTTATRSITANTAPSAVTAAATPTVLCPGGSLTLTGAAIGATSYSWNGPGGYTATDLNPASFTVGTVSSGVYTLSAINSCATVTATTTAVNVGNGPAGVAATPSATALCVGNTLTLTGAATGADSYTWAGPDGFSSTSLTPASFSVTSASAGIYTFTATNSCGSNTATATVSVNDIPSGVTATASSTALCSGNTLTLTATASGASSYSWSGPGGFSSTDMNPGSFPASISAAGVYTFVATSACGTVSATTASVVVNALPVATIAGTATITTGSSTTLTFTGNNGDVIDYSWTGGGTATTTIDASGSSIVTVSPATTTTYSITGATSAAGCFAAITGQFVTITVDAGCTGAPTGVAANLSSASLCDGATATLTGAATDALSYSWSGPAGFSSTDLNPASFTATTSAAGIYTLTATNSCGSTIATITLAVTTAPTAVSASASASALCVGNTLTLTGSATGAISYSWAGPGSYTATDLNPASFTASTSSAGIYTLTATNACGSVTAATASVSISDVPVVPAITGATSVTVGSTTTLSNTTSGGAWSSSTTSVATINATTGVVSGVSVGVSYITYSVTNSCGTTTATQMIMVNPVATEIIGWDASTMPGGAGNFGPSPFSATTLNSNLTLVSGLNRGAGVLTPSTSTGAGRGWGGTDWLASTIASAITAGDTVSFVMKPASGYKMNLSSFVLSYRRSSTGASAGELQYSLNGGAYTTCATLTYSATASSGATLGAVNLSGVSALQNIPSTSTVTFRIANTGGSSTTGTWYVFDVAGSSASDMYFTGTIVPNCTGAPTAVTASAAATTLCSGASLSLSGAATGATTYSWSGPGGFSATTLNPAAVTVSTLSAGVYTLTAANFCGSTTATTTITVNTTPTDVVATPSATALCSGATLSLSGSATGATTYSWSGPGGYTATGATPSGFAFDASYVGIYTLSATNSCGTTTTTTASVTLNPLADAGTITGSTSACIGSPALYSDTVIGGVWSSSDLAVATISATGELTPVSNGTTTISYAVTNTCGTSYATLAVTVGTSPVAGVITGASSVCTGSQVTLTPSIAGGSWTTSSSTTATVDASGVVTGVATGDATITYTLSTGCGTAYTTVPVTIITVPATPPAISGPSAVCYGATVSLSNAVTGGSWSSSDTAIANINTSGIVTGVAAGTANITYTVTNTCGNSYVTAPITVNPLPVVEPITGVTTVCTGAATTLSSATPGGSWSSSAATATVDASGIVTGVSGGTTTISYSVTNSCGTTTVTAPVTINTTPVVAAITGTTTIAVGATTTLANTTAGGSWTSANTSVATITGTGAVTGLAVGTSVISYTVTNLCGSTTVTITETVNTPVTGAYAMWDFTGSTSGLASTSTSAVVPTSGTSSGIGNSLGTVAAPINSTSPSSYSGASAGNNIGNAAATGPLSSSSAYVQFTLTPNTGYYLTITGIQFGERSTGTGPAAYTIKTSVDGYSAALGTGTNSTGGSWALLSPTIASVNGGYNSPVTVRIYGHSGTGAPGSGTINWRLDDIKINFTANPVPCSGTPAAGTIAGATAICGSGSATLTFTPGTTLTGTSYQWASSESAAGPFTPISGATSNTYNTGTLTDSVYYVVTTSCSYSGLSANTGAAAMLVSPIPVVDITTASPTCAGSAINATGADTYVWTPATGLSASTGATVTPAATITATTYTVTGTTIAGCTNTDTITVYPTPVLVVSAGSAILCGTGSTTITATGAESYEWSPAATLDATTGSSVVATPTSATVYTVTGSNSYGCSATDTILVSVGTPVTVSVGILPSVCQPLATIPVPFSSTGSPSSYTITWSSDAIAAGFSNVTASVPVGVLNISIPTTGTPGSYTGVITATNGTCTSSPATLSATIYAQPTASVTGVINPCVGYVGSVDFEGTNGATVDYTVDGGAINHFTFSGTTYSLSTGVVNANKTYVILSANNPVCSNTIDTTVVVDPTPMKWVGGATGHETEWSYAANWTCGFEPTSYDNVTIDAATYTPVVTIADEGITRNLSLTAGAALFINSGASLSVKGDINNVSTISGTGKVVLSNTSTQHIRGLGRINNLELNNAAGAVIDTAARLTIGNTLYLSSGTLSTNDSLELASDTFGTARIAEIASGADISGKVRMSQYVAGGYRRFRFISHPFSNTISLGQLQSYMDITGTGGASRGFTPTGSNAPSAFRYDPYTANDTLSYSPGWKPFTRINATAADTNLFHPGQGIRLFIRGAKGEGLSYDGFYGSYTPSSTVIKMTGDVNKGDVDVVLAQGSNPVTQSLNMAGNPYPSPVDLGTVMYNAKQAGEITGSAFYVWVPRVALGGQYMTVPIGTSAPIPYYIQANAAYQVAAAHDGAVLHFTENTKTANYDNYLFKPQSEYVTLNVYDNSYHLWDKLDIQFNEAATANADKDYDAIKPMGTDLNFFAITNDGMKMAIDARPYGDEQVIPLGINSNYAQQFIIRAESVAVPANGKLTLHDKLLNKYVDLAPGTEYAFSITADKATQGSNRFELGMKPATASLKGLSVSMKPNPATDDVKITFTSGISDEVKIRVMDISGVSIYNSNVGAKQSGIITVPMANFAAGVYMVEITQGNQKITQRLVKE